MVQIKRSTSMVFVSGKGNESAQYLHALSHHLGQTELRGQNIVVCAGGDGTFLQAIRDYGPEHRYLPINMGTRGYLMNRRMPAQKLALHMRRWQVKPLAFRRIQIAGHSKHQAFNEIAIVPNGDQAAKLMVYVNNQPVSNEPVIGSGVMLTTAQGSTGWSMACGSAAVHPLLDILCLTFINAYSPRVPPMILPSSSIVKVEVVEPSKRPCIAKLDGRAERIVQEQYVLHAGSKINAIYTADHNFTRRMIGKVIR